MTSGSLGREATEAQTGRLVITTRNAADFSNLISNLIEDKGKDNDVR